MDVIFEWVGLQDTITQVVENARKGSDIIIVGMFGKYPLVNLGFVQDRELIPIGTLMYQSAEYELAVSLVADGKIQLDPLITHRLISWTISKLMRRSRIPSVNIRRP
jgi:L-iditol 2-dehydrogenase